MMRKAEFSSVFFPLPTVRMGFHSDAEKSRTRPAWVLKFTNRSQGLESKVRYPPVGAAVNRCARHRKKRGGSDCALPCVPTSCLPSDFVPVCSLTQCLKQHLRLPKQCHCILRGETYQPWPKQQPVSCNQSDTMDGRLLYLRRVHRSPQSPRRPSIVHRASVMAPLRDIVH